jgi:hypothetical protein
VGTGGAVGTGIPVTGARVGAAFDNFLGAGVLPTVARLIVTTSLSTGFEVVVGTHEAITNALAMMLHSFMVRDEFRSFCKVNTQEEAFLLGNSNPKFMFTQMTEKR